MFYNKEYYLSSKLNYNDLNDLTTKSQILIDEISARPINESTVPTYQNVNGKSTLVGTSYQLDGDTTQYTTTGKNLLKPNPIATTTKNGITASYNATEQTFTFNGTCTTDNTTFSLGNNIVEFVNGTTKSTTYWVSGSVSTYCQMRHFNSDYTVSCSYLITTLSSSVPRLSKTTTSTFTCPATQTSIRFNNGSVANNFKIKIMVANSEDTDYEEYTNGVSPNPDFPQLVDNITGGQRITVCKKNLIDLNSYLVPGGYSDTSYLSTSTNYITLRYIAVKPNTTYTLSTNINISKYTYLRIVDFDRTITMLRRKPTIALANVNTFTTSSDAYYIALCFYTSQTASTSDLTQAQLEQGSTGTSYEAFKGSNHEINLGKQMISLTNGTYTASGITVTVSNGTVSVRGTATANAFITIPTNNTINWVKGETYTVCAFNTSSNSNVRIRVDSNGNVDTSLSTIKAIKTFTYTTQSIYKTGIVIRVENGTTILSGFKFTPMIIRGENVGNFAYYKEPIELCKIGNYQDFIRKGLGVNKLNITSSGSKTSNGITSVIQNQFISISGTATANSFIRYPIQPITLKAGVPYTFSINNKITVGTSSNYACLRFNNGTSDDTATEVKFDTLNNKITIIKNVDTTYTQICIRTANGLNDKNIVLCPQLQEGTQQTTYEPYGYGGKWYIYKEVGKVILNGSESWGNQSTSTTGLYRYNLTYDDLLPGYKNAISDHFTMTNETSFGNVNTVCFATHPSNHQFAFWSNETSVANFKTWLGSNNTLVYYVLNIPTATEITDADLIIQLQNVWRKVKYEDFILVVPSGHYDLNMRKYILNDIPYVEDIDKLERNIMNVSYDFFQPVGYIQNKIWRNWNETDVYKSFSYQDMNRIITDMNILWEHKDDKPTIYGIFTNENWDGETTLEWE